jgi:uncharacterized protein YciI
MKHFMVEILYLVPFEEMSEIVPEHRAFLQGGYDRGWLLMSGPMVPKTGGIVIARAPSLEDIRAFFANDPYLLKGVANHRIVEFEPVKRQAQMEEWVTGD